MALCQLQEHAAGPSCAVQTRGGQVQPDNSALLISNKVPFGSQGVDEGHCSDPDENFKFYHDSAGSLPGLTEQSGLAPAERAALRHISAWGAAAAPTHQSPLLDTAAQRTSFEMVPEERRISIEFRCQVAPSPFEAGLSEHRCLLSQVSLSRTYLKEVSCASNLSSMRCNQLDKYLLLLSKNTDPTSLQHCEPRGAMSTAKSSVPCALHAA